MDKAAEKPLRRRFSAALPEKRHILALVLILALCCGLFLWVGYVYLRDAADASRREIVNDDYSTVTEPLGAGGEIHQTLYAEGRLYGVVLDVTTYERVARGTLHLRLLNEAGQVAAACDTDMVQLLDNTFHRFIFDTMVDAGSGAQYVLSITTSPETKADLLGFHRSDGTAQDYIAEGEDTPHYPLDGFTLAQNGQPVGGTLALQYVVRYAGPFIVWTYSFFAALLTVFLLALYVFIFIMKAPLHRVFILCALVLGFVFMFLIPPRTAPDEYSHIYYSYHYANVVLGQAENDWANGLWMRAGDAMMLHRYDFDATDVFAYQDLYEGLWQRDPGGAPVQVFAYLGNRFPLANMIPTVGIVLARLLGLGRVGMLLAGRAANLIFYTLVASRAIKRMPIAKGMLFCVGLLPMCLQLAASFSYDTYVLALGFYFVAYCLDCILKHHAMGIRQILMLGVVAVLLAPAKAVYLAMLPLLLFIPASKYASRAACWGARLGILAAACVMWLSFNMLGLMYSVGAETSATMAPDTPVQTTAVAGPACGGGPGDEIALAGPLAALATAEPPLTILPNGDANQLFSLVYILRHFPQAIKVVLRTLWEQIPLWLQGLVGGRLGEIVAIDIEINWAFTLGLLAVLALAALPDSEDTQVLSRKLRAGSLAISLVVIALFMLACLTWTPVNYDTIFGVQGRYFLPVLPLMLLAMRGRSLRFDKPVYRTLAYCLPVLTVLCQLDAFTIIIQR